MVTKAYCYFREAERSVDSLLADPGQWAAFVAYFQHKLGPFGLLVENITGPRTGNFEGKNHYHYAVETIPAIGTMRLVFNRMLYKITKKPKFTIEETFYINNSCTHFIDFVSLHSFEPTRAVLVRTAMYNSQFIIRRNTLGDALLEKCKHVEHFNQNTFVKHFKISEVAGW